MLSIWWKKRANWYQNGHPSWWWPRWYNLLTAPEIAVLLPDLGYPDVVAIRDIVLHAYGGVIKRITETQYAYDLLHYVMLFPLNDGWHTGIPHNRSTGNVTADRVLLLSPNDQERITSPTSLWESILSVHRRYVHQDRAAEAKQYQDPLSKRYELISTAN